MPNNTRIPLCPFYKDEKNKSISCEDVFRGFASVRKKYDWMDKYCCNKWERCPHAAELNAMYDRIDKGADMDTEQLKHKVEALTKELRHKATALGRTESRLRARDAEIRSLRRKNKELEEKRIDEFKKRRRAEIELERNGAKAFSQLQELTNTYKNALCYLLSQQPEQRMPESDIKAWADGKFCTVKRSYDDSGNMVWELITEETGEETEDHGEENESTDKEAENEDSDRETEQVRQSED